MESRRPYWQVGIRLLFSVLATAAFVVIGFRLLVFLVPFVIGWIIASIAAPLVNWLEKRLKIVKKLGSALIVILVLALIVLALYFGISRLAEEIGNLIRDFPRLYAQLESGLSQIGQTLSGVFDRLPSGISGDGVPPWRIWISIWASLSRASASLRSRLRGILRNGFPII